MFIIRDAVPADTDSIIGLHFAGLRESGSLSPDTSLDADLYHLAEHYPRDSARFLVAVTPEQRIVGMGAIRRHSATVYEIKRMRVAADARREGIAQAILDTLFEFVRGIHGVETLMLDTGEKQTAAQRLYEKNGFMLDARKNIGGIPSLIYKKSLKTAE
ncbi:GNAT family N-acetyltransferase [Musicola keenii]|uniref:GNAT family N-acetyltransferase n=1 Tax=Musicola keenii TaxID=2884250 RepID=UPI00177CA7A5|nr:GNAT family N-acetyltransferase [Musicola keenii]